MRDADLESEDYEAALEQSQLMILMEQFVQADGRQHAYRAGCSSQAWSWRNPAGEQAPARRREEDVVDGEFTDRMSL